MSSMIKLSELPYGQTARVIRLENCGIIRRRLISLGLLPGTELKALYSAASGDPGAYLIRGNVIAIRSSDAEKIIIITDTKNASLF